MGKEIWRPEVSGMKPLKLKEKQFVNKNATSGKNILQKLRQKKHYHIK